jgi:hypothetical protein
MISVSSPVESHRSIILGRGFGELDIRRRRSGVEDLDLGKRARGRKWKSRRLDGAK